MRWQTAKHGCQQWLNPCVAPRSCLHDHVPDKNVDLVRPDSANPAGSPNQTCQHGPRMQSCCGERPWAEQRVCRRRFFCSLTSTTA